MFIHSVYERVNPHKVNQSNPDDQKYQLLKTIKKTCTKPHAHRLRGDGGWRGAAYALLGYGGNDDRTVDSHGSRGSSGGCDS